MGNGNLSSQCLHFVFRQIFQILSSTFECYPYIIQKMHSIEVHTISFFYCIFFLLDLLRLGQNMWILAICLIALSSYNRCSWWNLWILAIFLIAPTSYNSFMYIYIYVFSWIFSEPGISASPSEENVRYFNVMIMGPAQSPYEGILHILLSFFPDSCLLKIVFSFLTWRQKKSSNFEIDHIFLLVIFNLINEYIFNSMPFMGCNLIHGKIDNDKWYITF